VHLVYEWKEGCNLVKIRGVEKVFRWFTWKRRVYM